MEAVTIGPCTLYHGDCREILPIIAGSDCVLSDPPYGVDIEEWDGMVPHDLLTIFLDVSSGPVVWFGSAPRLVDDAKSFPVEPERMMVWAPRFTLSKCAKDGFAYRYHPIWWWRVRPQNAAPWDVFTDSTECGNWWKHPCTKPVGLIRKIVAATSDEGMTVLDPFMGSGTTGVACVKEGRRFIGIEKEAAYFEIACKRIREAVKADKDSLFPAFTS